MDTRSKSKKKRLIILGSVLIIFLLAVFLGPRIWVTMQFNKEGNIILSNSNVNKIYEMTIDGLIVWSYDLYGDSVEYESVLWRVIRLPNGNTLISDDIFDRIYEINKSGEVVWSCDSIYGEGDTAYGAGSEIHAVGVTNGNILAVNYLERRGMVFEVDRDCNIIWQWSNVEENPAEWGEQVSQACYLQNGNLGVLIRKFFVGEIEKCTNVWDVGYLELDSNRNIVKRRDFEEFASDRTGDLMSNGHVLISYHKDGLAEYDTLGRIIWSYQPPETIFVKGEPTPNVPFGDHWSGFRCSNGNTLISDFMCSRVYVVDSLKNVLSYFRAPAIKSKFGIQYVTERQKKSEGEIDYLGLMGVIVDK
jgi:hypothetical protein